MQTIPATWVEPSRYLRAPRNRPELPQSHNLSHVRAWRARAPQLRYARERRHYLPLPIRVPAPLQNCGSLSLHPIAEMHPRPVSHFVAPDDPRHSHFAALYFSALHSGDGNSAAAFTFIPSDFRDGQKEDSESHDPHRCREHRSRIFAQISRQQGILARHPRGTRPRSRRILQNFLPGLPIYIPFSRTPLQTLRRPYRNLSGYFSRRCSVHNQIRPGVWNNISDAYRRRKWLRGLQRL